MTTMTQPTADDLRAALLTACAAAGHTATLDARGECLTFTADGATVPVQIEGATRASYGSKATPPTIVLARFSPHARRFRPPSGLFDWPLVAREARGIAAALRVEAEREEERMRETWRAQARADTINASLGLARGAALRAGVEGRRLVLMVGGRGSVEASEEQIRVMVAAARGCGLVAGKQAAESGEGQTV